MVGVRGPRTEVPLCRDYKNVGQTGAAVSQHPYAEFKRIPCDNFMGGIMIAHQNYKARGQLSIGYLVSDLRFRCRVG